MVDWASVAWIAGMIVFVRVAMWLSEMAKIVFMALMNHEDC